MQKRFVSGMFFTLTLIVLVLGANSAFSDESDQISEQALIEHGRYLVTIAGCGDCHTPKVFKEDGMHEDSSRLFAGHPQEEVVEAVPSWIGKDGWIAGSNAHLTAWAGPWGISFATNLTSDRRTGLGKWTAEKFISAIRTGKHYGMGREILPPMPWRNLARASDEDLTAMFAFFMSTRPIENKVPRPIPPSTN